MHDLRSGAHSELKDSTLVSLVSWNIQVGSDHPLLGNNWRKRKNALKHMLLAENADIVCLQEPLLGQLQFLQQALPHHLTIGVGRDDGDKAGEHCPIFYRAEKFALLQSGTFWLSDTPDSAHQTWDIFFKRICTWSRFLDQLTGYEFCIFNTHFPLNIFAQSKAAALVIERMRSLHASARVLLTGDFNCNPQSDSWKLFQQGGLLNSELLVRDAELPSATYHILGHAIACIDAVFVSEGVKVREHRILNQSDQGIWPSDHFGSAIQFQLMP